MLDAYAICVLSDGGGTFMIVCSLSLRYKLRSVPTFECHAFTHAPLGKREASDPPTAVPPTQPWRRPLVNGTVRASSTLPAQMCGQSQCGRYGNGAGGADVGKSPEAAGEVRRARP